MWTLIISHKTKEWTVRHQCMKTQTRVINLLTITALIASCNLPVSGDMSAWSDGSATPRPIATVIAGTTAPLSITIPPPPPEEISTLTPAVVSPTEIAALTDIVAYDDLDEMLELTNQARCEQGLSPLSGNPLLSDAAAQHNLDMLLNNFFDHNGSDGTTVGDRTHTQGYTWLAVGENLAAGSTSTAETFDLWWESPGHKANILNADFREAGLSHLFQVGSQWSHYWTMVFANQGIEAPTCAEVGF